MDVVQVIVIAPDARTAADVAASVAPAAGLSLAGHVSGQPAIVVLARSTDVDIEARELVERLSDRELDVLQELVDGSSIGDAAANLTVSANTVRTHVKHVLAKLGVSSSLKATSVAVRSGMRPRAQQRSEPERGGATGRQGSVRVARGQPSTPS